MDLPLYNPYFNHYMLFNDHNLCVFASVCCEDSSRKPMIFWSHEPIHDGIVSINIFISLTTFLSIL